MTNETATKLQEFDFEKDRRVFLDSHPGVKTFQLFDDSEIKDPKKAKIFHCHDLPVNWISRLEYLNDQKTGIFLTINETNGKGRTIKDVVRVRAVFADFDGQPIDDVWIDTPSMVIESSKGKYHAYWLTDDTPLESFTTIQEAIAAKYNSDPKVKDLPRVMRVPGFMHMKGEPFMTRIISYTGEKFKFGELVSMFPPKPRLQWSAPKWHKDIKNYANAEFKGVYGTTHPGRNVHLAARIGGMLKRGLSWQQVEIEAMKEAVACVPPLTENETRNILKSMRRYH